jgi:hypothetical protein
VTRATSKAACAAKDLNRRSRVRTKRYYIYRTLGGKKALARTHTSHGKGFDIDDHLLAQMARQCGLTKKQFLDLLDCPLSREEYEKIPARRSLRPFCPLRQSGFWG